MGNLRIVGRSWAPVQERPYNGRGQGRSRRIASTMGKHRILLVEDEPAVCFSVTRFFVARGYEVRDVDAGAKAEEVFRTWRPDVTLLDYRLPDRDGIEVLRALRAMDPSVPCVILTGHATIDLAVRAVKEGAEQFFTKPVELSALLVVVERLIENQRNRQLSLARKSHQSRQAIDPFLGESAGIKRLAEQARRVLPSSSPVLIQGETGTGKGLLATWLHQNGPRAEEAFVDLNCAGLSREFLETELFGHEKGAFTGAVTGKQGLLEIAHRGTAFLDEIGDVDVQVQPKLLKVLEEHRFHRLGNVRDRQVDIRLIAATHQDLARLVQERRFRSDLFYRINALPLYVPPLRERGRDVVALTRTLLEGLAADLGRPGVTLTGAAERAIETYAWPGNIRELRNVLERAVLLGESRELTAADLAEGISPASSAEPRDCRMTLDEAERRHLEAVLRGEQGNVAAAAVVLGLSRSALYQKIKKHRIIVPRG